jgi:hypothetical protein
LVGGLAEELFQTPAEGFDQFAGVGLLLNREGGTRHGFLTTFSSGV